MKLETYVVQYVIWRVSSASTHLLASITLSLHSFLSLYNMLTR